MHRIYALAGAILGVVVLTLGVAQAAPGPDARPTSSESHQDLLLPASAFEPRAATPPAAKGSQLAERRGLSASQLRRKLRAGMRAAGGSSGSWVYDLNAKRSLFKDHSSRRRILASNTKLFTTTAVLARYGANGRFQTRVWLRGTRSGPARSTLKGGIALVGAGDPALGSTSFARANGLPVTPVGVLANKIKASGIRKVTGSITADPSVFDGRNSVPQPGITGGPYLGPLSGLSYNSGFDDGHYAKSPPRLAGVALRKALIKRGVRVKGSVKIDRVPARVTKKRRFAAVPSPSVATLLAATNKPSNNFYAEMLLKRLAVGKRPATTKKGARKAEQFANKHGSGVSMVNGSGLSRTNRASPHEVGRLLAYAKRNERLRKALPASLSIAGRDGTLANRMRGTAAQGRCRGKTGTVDGVSALSGYCKTGGRTLVFSILMNSVDITSAQNAQDSMVAAIARYK